MSAPEPTASADDEPVTLTIRGGGWTLILAGALILVLVGWRLPILIGAFRNPVGDRHGFDVDGFTPEQRATLVTAAPRSALPTLREPALLTPAEGEAFRLGHSKLLVRGDRVVGVTLGDESVAYPLRILNWHEVVEHTLGGIPIAVTYSGLCDSVAVYDRRVDGETLEIGVSGLLIDSNPLLFDRRGNAGSRTESLWLQLTGEALSGPKTGARLERIPAVLTTWELWKLAHPETRVIQPDLERGKLYKRDPYSSYEGTDAVRFPVEPPAPAGLSPKARVLAVEVGGQAAVYALSDVEAAAQDGRWSTTLGSVPLEFRLTHDPAGVQPDTLVVVAPGGEPVLSTPSFWFAWHAQHPEVPRVQPQGAETPGEQR